VIRRECEDEESVVEMEPDGERDLEVVVDADPVAVETVPWLVSTEVSGRKVAVGVGDLDVLCAMTRRKELSGKLEQS
jgi:hypothetical protein